MRPAWDPVKQAQVWSVEYAAPRNGGTLATAGNLVFQGGLDGRFIAYNGKTGEKLWDTATGHVSASADPAVPARMYWQAHNDSIPCASQGGTIATAGTKYKGNLPMLFRLKKTLLATVVLVGVHMSVSSSSQASPEKTPANGPANVLLVHGAWADGSSWSKVIPLLQAKGLHVVAVQNPLTSLADDVAATKRAIALQNGPVVLVGHSYGGTVITEAGNDPKVVGLVFVAAFAPGDGESVASISKPYPAA